MLKYIVFGLGILGCLMVLFGFIALIVDLIKTISIYKNKGK